MVGRTPGPLQLTRPNQSISIIVRVRSSSGNQTREKHLTVSLTIFPTSLKEATSRAFISYKSSEPRGGWTVASTHSCHNINMSALVQLRQCITNHCRMIGKLGAALDWSIPRVMNGYRPLLMLANQRRFLSRILIAPMSWGCSQCLSTDFVTRQLQASFRHAESTPLRHAVPWVLVVTIMVV